MDRRSNHRRRDAHTDHRHSRVRRGRALAGLTAVALVAGLLGPRVATAGGAPGDIDETRCVVEPTTSTGTQSGVTAVAAGEQVRVGLDVDLAAGVVFQDILANPDGSPYVASWLGVAPPAGSALVADLGQVSLTIDGIAEPLTPGTQPDPTSFVLDTSGPVVTVYFPGDPAVLADPTGTAAPSYTVPDGGQTFRLTYPATVGDLAAGAISPAATCHAAISYGAANAAVDQREAAVAALGLDVVVTKSADLPVLSPSATVTYSIEVAVPAFDATGEIRNGTAYDTVVTDDLPDGLDYVAGSASHGGTESGGVLMWTIPEIAAGSSVTLTYELAVPTSAPPGATFTNDATATTTSQPGAVAGEATRTADGSSVTLTNGAAAPTIAKAASTAVAGTNQLVTYTVGLTWPAGSTWHDVTITDLLPDGLTLENPAASFTCAPVACPAMAALTPFVSPAGTTRFGRYVPELGPFADDQTWTWTYTARLTGAFTGGAPVPLGTALDNLAEVRFNLVPRLGGAVPNPARLAGFDVVVGDTAPVEFNRPVVAIDKAAPAASPVEPTAAGLTYTVTLTNTGGVDATNVTFTDPGPTSNGFPLGTILAASVTGATYNPTTRVFTVASVPDGGTSTVTYRVVGAPASAVAVEGEYLNTATLTGYRDPANNVYTASLADPATVVVVQPELVVDKERLSASPIAGTDGETITYRIEVTNVGDASAFDVAGTDERDFPGPLVPGTCEGGMTISAAGAIALAQLAPDGSASCTYTVEIDGDRPEGPLTNTATVAWRNGFGQTGEYTPATGVVPWTATDEATTTVVHPQLALNKTPDAETPGNVIANGQTGTYTITVTNVGPVPARNVVVGDTLPPGLSLEAAPTVATTPNGIAHTITGAPGARSFTVTIPALAPGELARITAIVRHDGVEPADEPLVNTAKAEADGITTPLTDTGVLVWVPNIVLPTATKGVTPASAGIGETVTWTVTATVPENTVDVYDVAFVDTLPDGTAFGSYGAVTCVSGPLCATVPAPTPLTPAVLSSGDTRLGWFVGDVPAGTAPTTYTFAFTSSIAATYSGTGTPAAGTSVTDTLLANRVQPWLTISAARDSYDDGSLPDVGAPVLTSQFERRGAIETASVRVVTPRVIVDKAITNLGPAFVWQTEAGSGSGHLADAGDAIAYTLTIENVGGADAHDVVVTDTMGQAPSGTTVLRDVAFGPLPAGVTIADGWTPADPDVVLHVDELAAGAEVTVTYSGTVAPSDELVPGFSGDNRDIALVRNLLEVPEFRSAPDGGGLLFAGTFATGVDAYVYTPSPYMTGAACVGGPSAPAGTTATFVANTRNGAPPPGEGEGTLLTTGYPPDPSIGAGHDTTLTIELSPDIRYVAASARVNGDATPDPALTLDTDASVQTLVFDLGTVPQDSDRNVTFQVRTIADGVQGGMLARLAMDDASGSPSRGTGVPGAGFVYEFAVNRGCLPGLPLTIRKFPDLSAEFEGKKQYKAGEEIRWTGDVFGGGAQYHDGAFIDTLPAGLEYEAGSAVFVVTPMSGPTTVVSTANGNLTETVTPLPDGRTELRFTSAAFAVFRTIDYQLDTVVGDDAIVGATLTNVIELLTSDGIVDPNCGDPVVAVCDNGQVQIISSATPTVVKAVDHPAGPWGDTFAYTVDVTLPGNAPYFDAVIGDRGDYPRALDPDVEPFAASAIECLAGCDGDPAPVTLPVWSAVVAGDDPDEVARAWFLGDLAAQLEPRLYRVTYEQTFVDPDEYEAEFGVEPASETFVNEAIVTWNDANTLDDATYQPGGGAHTPASSRTFAIASTPRGADDAAVDLVRPALSVEKTCQGLDGRDDPATSSSFAGEAPDGVPNFRCVLTATNTTDPILATTLLDPTFVDALPTVSSAGGRAVTTQLISSSSDELLVAVEETEVPGSTLTPPALSALRVTAEGLELEPGESVSVTVDLRVTASDAFWANAALVEERSANTVTAESFADAAGNEYRADDTDAWDLVVTKPDLTVSERAFGAGRYEPSLADPTACLAYEDKPDPLIAGRVAGRFTDTNECSNLAHARGQGSASLFYGPDYARAYSGYGAGAPDVPLGSRDPLTWAVDVAVVSADDFSTVAVADQIPYGFEYVPGSARLAHWAETGTTHTPLPDPVMGAAPPVTCTEETQTPDGANMNFVNIPASTSLAFYNAGLNYGQLPWTPLTWTFAEGGTGAAGAFWDDGLAYLNGANRGAAGATTDFDRIVRVVFEVRPRAEFDECLQRPARANSFRSAVTASGTTGRGAASSTALGWLVGVELARVEKSPDGAISPDGTTATYGIDVTITDPTRILHAGSGSTAPTNAIVQACPSTALPAPPALPWAGLGDLSRNGTEYVALMTATEYGTDFGTELVVTDTLVDDGHYVPGSATFDMRDPWGRPFSGHLASEDVEVVTVGGRPASRVTWSFDFYPSPVNVTTGPVASFPCATVRTPYYTHPSSMHISVPLPIPEGTPDGTTHPNTAAVTSTHLAGSTVLRTQTVTDDALITVRNPQPPPPTTKTAAPDEVAPGATFQWIVAAALPAGAPWFDLGWTDVLPASMELLAYGTPSCVTGTATPCSLVPETLAPVDNPDGSTTLGWFAGDVAGAAEPRTVRMPITVRFVGDEVAGDALTNVVTGYSNEDDLVDTIDEPADPSTFFFTGDPVTGVAMVVEPDLTITKSVTNGPGPFQAGAPVTYAVVVTNNGGATAFDVPVSDVPGASLVSVTTASPFRSKGWTALDPRVEWFLPALGPGESVTLDLAGVVASDYAETGIRTLTNTATVAAYTSRPEVEEHARAYPAEQAAATVPLVAPDLGVTKFAGADCEGSTQLFEPGQPVDWCVVVANAGDAPAHEVTLTDLLPAGWTYVAGSATIDGGAAEPTVGTTAAGTSRLGWALGDVGPDTDVVVRYRTIGAGGPELVTNTALVDSTLPDGSPLPEPTPGFAGRSSAQAAALGAGLQLAKLPDQQRFACDRTEGCPVTWELVVVNTDDVDLEGASVTDFLPGGLTYDSSTAPAGWSDAVVASAGSGPAGTTPITWTNDGTFAAGATATFTLTAIVPPGSAERRYLNHAAASADTVPQVENQALAAVFSTGSIGDFVWRDDDNDGRQDAGEPGFAGVGIQLVDADGNVLATTATDADGRYRFTGLAPGTYRVRFLAPAGWTLSPSDAGADDTGDSDAGADGRTATIDLPSGTDDLDWDAGLFPTPVASYTVRKQASTATARPGDIVTYRITVTNTGNVPYTPDAPARFSDDLSDVLDDARYNGDADNGATFADPVLSWAGALAVGASTTITYSVTVDDPVTGDRRMRNVVVTPVSGPVDPGGCGPASANPACRTVTEVAADSVAPRPVAPLPRTGAETGPPLALGLLAIGLGALVLVLGRILGGRPPRTLPRTRGDS